MTLDKLRQFRTGVYTILGNAKDALFDLMDAVLVTRSVYSFVELSVSPVFRRQWSSIYEAIEDGKPPRDELMQLYIQQLPQTEQLVLAGDRTAWSRLADKLFRLRSNRVLYGVPNAYTGIGRPRIHGDKFKLNDSLTWWMPDQMVEVNEPKLGQLRLRLWCHLHFRQSAKHSMHLIQVERLNEDIVSKSRPLWLAWVGDQMPALCQFWRLYLRRFGVDHWYRFAKQRLHWTLPKLSTPEQCERWSDLLPLMTWQLW